MYIFVLEFYLSLVLIHQLNFCAEILSAFQMYRITKSVRFKRFGAPNILKFNHFKVKDQCENTTANSWFLLNRANLSKISFFDRLGKFNKQNTSMHIRWLSSNLVYKVYGTIDLYYLCRMLCGRKIHLQGNSNKLELVIKYLWKAENTAAARWEFDFTIAHFLWSIFQQFHFIPFVDVCVWIPVALVLHFQFEASLLCFTRNIFRY